MKAMNLLILSVFLFFGCSQRQMFVSESLQKIISTIPIDSFVLKENKKMPIVLNFYTIDGDQFLQIFPTIGYFTENLKGYLECCEYLILYSGYDDSLTKKYINYLEPDILYLNSNYLNSKGYDIDIPSNKIYYYKILNDTVFEKFTPNNEHLLYLNSYILSKAPIIPKE